VPQMPSDVQGIAQLEELAGFLAVDREP
jgi:hypothetical protein